VITLKQSLLWIALVATCAILTGCSSDFFATPQPPTEPPIIIAASATVVPVLIGGDNDEDGSQLANQYTPSSLEDVPTPQGTPAILPSATIPGVSFSTQYIMDDGLIVYGQFTVAALTPAPLIVLLPDVSGNKTDYNILAPLLAAAGFNVLAVDIRSAAGSTYNPEAASADVMLILTQSRSAPGVDANRISLLGAGISANLALSVCANDYPCRALILLSPTVTGGGIDSEVVLAEYAGRPLLIVAARSDEPAGRDSLRLNGLAQPASRLILENGVARGAALLTPDVSTQIVAWLRQNGL